jgi:RNA polymerase sigma-70 factor (ECF subfamily)
LDRTHDDARFIAALRRRDERAFNRLVVGYQDQVFTLCLRLLGSREEARDVAQDVFVTIFQKIDTFRGDAKLSTWIFRVAANHAKNRIKYLSRRHDRDQDSFDDMPVPPASGKLSASFPDPDEALAGARLERTLHRALARLDEDQRALVVLRDLQGMTYEEIAEVTGLNLGTIKSRLHRGRAYLKTVMDAWMDGRDIAPDPQGPDDGDAGGEPGSGAK